MISRTSLSQLQRDSLTGKRPRQNDGVFSWFTKLFKSNKCVCGSKHKPVYNFLGTEGGMWCVKCKEETMVDVVNNKIYDWQLPF